MKKAVPADVVEKVRRVNQKLGLTPVKTFATLEDVEAEIFAVALPVKLDLVEMGFPEWLVGKCAEGVTKQQCAARLKKFGMFLHEYQMKKEINEAFRKRYPV